MDAAPIRVLLVEDSPGDARLVSEALREAGSGGFEVLHVARLADALAYLERGEPDVVLLDLSLPDAAGLSTVKRAHLAAPDVPIVVLTGLRDEALALEAVKAGAQDYLMKDELAGPLLVRAIRYAVERTRAEWAERFLANAAELLASSLDYEETLQSVARLAVESLADYCVIDIVDDDGEIRRLEVAHADGAKQDLARELLRFPVDRHRPHLVHEVLRRREPLLVEQVEDAQLQALAQSEDHLRILRGLAPQSYIAVPLLARDRLLGTLLFVASRHAYGAEDLRLAEELARRAALAVNDARLYKAARDAIRARDEVLRVVSHDLRNPLSTIAMTAELMMDPDVPLSGEERLRQLEAVRRAAARMDRLIQDLLDVARIEAGRLALDPQPSDPGQLVQEAVAASDALASSKPVALRSRAADPGPPVLADHDRVLQVFGNLIGNAIKFTPVGGRITVGVELAEGEAVFSVQDTGPGIPPEQLSQLFRPFWQGRRGGRDGAGLGLAISRGIVEAHGGRIWAESELGAGTTMRFTLPLAQERRGTDPRADPSAAAAPNVLEGGARRPPSALV